MLTETSFSLRPFMANLCYHIPSFTRNQCSSSFLHQQLRYSILRFPQISRPKNVVITATSSSSTKNVKKRRTRSVKSNSELCNDLKEFVSLVGLPEGHVPSWKELTQHGRKDLANIVRRRGYKLITELLKDSHEESTIASAENQDANCDFENVIVDEKSDPLVKKIPADLEEKDPAPSDDNLSWSSADLAEKESAASDNFDWSSTVLTEKESAPSDDNFNWSSAILAAEESAPSDDNFKRSSADMAEKETSTSDDNLSWSSAVLAEKESAPGDDNFSWSSADYADKVSAPGDDNFSWDNLSKDNDGQPPIIGNTQSSTESSTSSSLQLQDRAAKFVLNGVLDAIEGENHEGERFTELVAESLYSEESAKHEAAESNAISTCTASTEVSELVAPLATEYSGGRNDLLSAEELDSSHNEAGERNNQVEIDHLKVMLHQKELELTQLKERIEKEKIALSNLQAKAEMEIEKTQEIIMAKHEELQAAEESLSGLKEVEIEFWGNHETVEVAGSFNGWHQPIYMDPVPSSTSINPTGRNLNLWSTKLWLYPGVYEIKFIVDGHWTIDPQRETTSRGTIQNNILIVER